MSVASQAYEAIGRAVVDMQLFETNFVITAELFHLVTRPKRRRKTQGLLTEQMLEEATKSILRRLSEKGDIAPDFEKRIKSLVDDRHLLIHNWVAKNGLHTDTVAEDDVAYWTRYRTLAIRVQAEARSITKALADYVLKWGEPEWSRANPQEYRRRIKMMFLAVSEPQE